MLTNEARAFLTFILILIEIGGCFVFNNYIDRRAGKRFNGETAVWVGCGVLGVLIATVLVLALWWHLLPTHWIGAFCVGGIMLGMLFPAGVVMWWGDRIRYRNITDAAQILNELNRGSNVE